MATYEFLQDSVFDENDALLPFPWQNLYRQELTWSYELPFQWEDSIPFGPSRLTWDERHGRFRRQRNAEKKRLRAIKKREDFFFDEMTIHLFTPFPVYEAPAIPTRNSYELLEVDADAPQTDEPEGYVRWYSPAPKRALRNFIKRSRKALYTETPTHSRVRDGERIFWQDTAPGWMMGPDEQLWYNDEIHNQWFSPNIPYDHESEEIDTLFREYNDYPEFSTDPLLYSVHNAVRCVEARKVHVNNHRRDYPSPTNSTYDDILNRELNDEVLMNQLIQHNQQVQADLYNLSYAPSEDVCGNHLSPMRVCSGASCTRTASCKVCLTCAICCRCELSRSHYVRARKQARQALKTAKRHRHAFARNFEAFQRLFSARVPDFNSQGNSFSDSHKEMEIKVLNILAEVIRYRNHCKLLSITHPREYTFHARDVWVGTFQNRCREELGVNAADYVDLNCIFRKKQYNSQGLIDFTTKLPENFTITHVMELPFVTALTDALKDTNASINWPTVLKELAFCLMHIYQAGSSYGSIATSLAHFLSNVNVPGGTLTFVMTAITSYLYNSESVCDMLPVVGSLGALIIVILGCQSLPSDKSVDQLMQRTGQIGRIISTYDSIEKKLGPLFEHWADFIRVKLYGYSKREMEGWSKIDEWCEEVESLRTSHFERKVRESAALRSQVDTLHQRGGQIVRELDVTRVPLVARQRVTTCMMFLAQARTLAANTTAGLIEPRIAPIVIHFVGSSGVGKSTMLGYLNSDLLIAMGSTDPTDLHTKIHYRQSMDEFWSDLKSGTKGVVCDDAFARKDSENNPNPQVQEQIHMGNTAHYAPNMANASDKGTIIFRAAWVIWTTNRHHFAFPSLTNPEAVYNRVTLKFRVRPAEGFIKTKVLEGQNTQVLDDELLEMALRHDEEADQKCLRFDLLDTTSKTMTIMNDAWHREGYTFREMSDMCVQALNEKQKKGATYLKRQSAYFAKRLDPKPDEPKPENNPGPSGQPTTFSSLFSETLLAAPEVLETVRTATWPYNMPAYNSQQDYVVEEPQEHDRTSNEWEGGLGFIDAEDNSPSWTQTQFAKLSKKWEDLCARSPTPGYTETCEYFARPNVLLRAFRNLYDMETRYKGPFAPTVVTEQMEPGMDLNQREYEQTKGRYHLNVFKSLLNFSKAKIPMPAMCLRVNGTCHPFDYCVVLRHPNDAFGVIRAILNLFEMSQGKADPLDYLMKGYKLLPVDRCMDNHSDVPSYDNWCQRDWTDYQKPKLLQRFKNNCHKKFEDWATTIGAGIAILAEIGLAIFSMYAMYKGVDWVLKDVPLPTDHIRKKNKKYDAAFELMYGKQPNKLDRSSEGYEKTSSALPRMNHEAYDKTTSALPRMNHEGYDKTTSALPRTNHESASLDPTTNSESLSDQNAAEVRRKLFKNQYLISSKRDNGYSVHGTATFLSGRVLLTNRHIWANLHPTFVLSNNSNQYEITKAECSVSIPSEAQGGHEYKDVVLIECPRFVPLHATIKHFFMTRADFAQHNTLARVEVVGFDRNGRHLVRGSDLVRAEDRESFQLVDPAGTWYIREHYWYGVETEKGDCGSLAVAFDPSVNRKIIGCHMAGGPAPYTGCATAVHQEFLNSLLSQLKLRYPESINDADVPVERPLNVQVVNGQFVCAEKTFKGFSHCGTAVQRVHAAVKTKLRPSPCHGITQAPTKAPARLAPFEDENGDTISPMFLAMAKAKTPCFGVDQKILRDAAQDVRHMILRRINPADRRNLTFEESISGIPGNPYYTPMNRSAGPGYGWPKKGRGKTTWLGEDEYNYSHPDFLKRWDEVQDALNNGVRPFIHWTDTLKDELRSLEKVKLGKTRLFAAGEQVFTAMLRKYFMGFCAHIMAHNVDFESCVGINPLSSDWSRVANKMRELGSAITAGDFTNYDGSLLPDLMWELCDIINEFYDDGPANAAIRRQLFIELLNSIHVNGDRVYMWDHSQPSGCAMTVIINSVIHSLLVRMVFIACALKYAPEQATMVAYNKSVRHVNYGDDDLTNISPTILEWFHQHTQTEMYPLFGMTYTDETKSADAPRYRKLEDVSFLKRKFRWDKEQARWRAPLSLDTILEMCNWVRGPDTYSLAALELQEAYYELSQHDEDTFNRVSVALDKAASVVEERVRVPRDTYHAYQRVDGYRYGNVATISTSPTSGDQGLTQMTETRLAANPAPSDSCPSMGASNSQCGGVFTPTDKCVPHTESIQHQRLLVQSNSQGNESSLGPEHRLATSTPMPGNATATLYGAGTTNESGPSFAGTSRSEVHQITTFEQDGEVEVGQRSQPTRALASYLKGAEDKLANEISGFLSRPIQIGQFDWLASTGSLGELFTFDLPKNYLTIPMIAEKLRGFRYFRCDFVIEVQINAQPFNAGALIAWYNPLYSQMTYLPSSAGFLGGVTGYPKVIYRCGDATSVQLRIPYNNILSHFDLVKQFGTMGRFVVDIMSPLTGSADADGTVWIWAENIDFTMPTGLATLPFTNSQAGDETAETLPDVSSVAEDAMETATTPARNERRRRGPVETASTALSMVSAGLALVPALSWWAAPAAIVFGAAGKLAHLFGWSKPMNPEYATLYAPSLVRNSANYNGDSMAKVLALDYQNVTDIPVEVFNTIEDEMAIQNIIRKPIFTDVFTWQSSNTQGQFIWKWPVDPSACNKRAETGTPNNYVVQFNNYVSYLSNLAREWRGGLCYDFMLVKTPFHSGRLCFYWAPGANLATDPTTLDRNKMYKKVYDIRTTTDIQFTIPYTWNAPWKRCVSPMTATPTDLTYNDPTGMIYVEVTNALRAPATAADTIEILMFVSGADDFQFAYPEINPALHVMASKDTLPVMPASMNSQGGDTFYPNTNPPEFDPNKISMGEAWLSLRTWLKRYIQYNHVAISGQNPTYFSNVFVNGPIPSAQGDLEQIQDAWTFVSVLYRFYSGSVRVLKKFSTTANTSPTYSLRPGPDNNTLVDPQGQPLVWFNTALEPFGEIELPFYQKWPALPTDLGVPQLADSTGGTYAYVPYNYGSNLLATDEPSGTTTYRQIGETFAFGFLLGPPATLTATP